MTMRTASPILSPCELIRKINDLAQGDTAHDLEGRKLCAEAEKQTKRLAQTLNKYKKEAWSGWWAENKGWRDLLEMRLKEDYKQEGSSKL
jgi:hypothetical protein